MSRRGTLGFDRKIELGWLDAAASIAAQELDVASAHKQLFSALEGQVSGDSAQSGRGKTVTVLSRVWLGTHATGVQRRALDAIESATPGERVAVHWAMCAATHPFFVDVAAVVGRLLRVQGEVALSQVTRRVAEGWGDRSTLHRAVQRTCRSFVAWDVLRDTKVRGIYEPSRAPLPVAGPAARLLIEALLTGGPREAAPLAEIVRHPAVFPFELAVTGWELRGAPEFRVDREGLDVDVVGRAAFAP